LEWIYLHYLIICAIGQKEGRFTMHQTGIKWLIATMAILFALSMSGCVNPIPPNEHVGKPPPNSYKDGYYYDSGPYYY
jgi:hypothetical protein